jgi:hypothetical protein
MRSEGRRLPHATGKRDDVRSQGHLAQASIGRTIRPVQYSRKWSLVWSHSAQHSIDTRTLLRALIYEEFPFHCRRCGAHMRIMLPHRGAIARHLPSPRRVSHPPAIIAPPADRRCRVVQGDAAGAAPDRRHLAATGLHLRSVHRPAAGVRARPHGPALRSLRPAAANDPACEVALRTIDPEICVSSG